MELGEDFKRAFIAGLMWAASIVFSITAITYISKFLQGAATGFEAVGFTIIAILFVVISNKKTKPFE